MSDYFLAHSRARRLGQFSESFARRDHFVERSIHRALQAAGESLQLQRRELPPRRNLYLLSLSHSRCLDSTRAKPSSGNLPPMAWTSCALWPRAA